MQTRGAISSRIRTWPSWVDTIALAVGVGVAYFFAAQLSLSLLTKPDGVAVFWPAAGIASGTLIAMGPAARLPVTLGVLTASSLASLLGDRSIPAATVFALCNAGEPLLVAWLIRRRFGKDFRLESLHSVLGLFAAAATGPALSGSVATVGFILFYSASAPILTTWLNWFASDALGIIMVAPLLIGLAALRREPPTKWELARGALTLAALVMVTTIAFGSDGHHWYTVLPLALLLPVLLAAYCRPVFAAAAALILGFAVVWTATFGIGDLGEIASLPDRVFAARATLVAISTCTLVLAALFAERRSAETALKDSNDGVADGLAAGQVIAFEWDAVTGQSRRSSSARLILGDEDNELVGAGGSEFLRRVHPDDRACFKARVREVRPDNPTFTHNFRFHGLDGREVWLEEVAKGEFDVTGKLLRIKGLTRDITERKRAEQILSERQAQLEVANNIARVGSYTYNHATGVLWLGPGSASIYGLHESCVEMTAEEWQRCVHPDDLERLVAESSRARANRKSELVCVFRILRNGEVRWIETRNRLYYDKAGRATQAIGASIDVTERRRAEDQKGLLLAELDHRVKNVLACVAAIARHASEGSNTVDEFLHGFNGRIQCLANTHALLSHTAWQGVSLDALIRGELASFMKDDNTDIRGPEIDLVAEATQPIAMVLHELATNAGKYGALSNSHGRVSVCWERQLNGGASSALAFEWRERGGPPVATPRKLGYGSTVIRNLIPYELGGTVDYVLAPDGASCKLEIPAKWLSPTNHSPQLIRH
ncbi:MAG: PAS domain-containing protein [Hyphomicrobiaceae bacterium]